jgi:hypothetical protein
MLPELTCPALLAMTLKFETTMPSNTIQRLSTLSIDGTSYNSPKYNPNSLMDGGMSVPSATAPRLIETCTSAPTSRETDVDIDFEVLAEFPVLVFNRFFTPEKSIGIGFSGRVSLNVPR